MRQQKANSQRFQICFKHSNAFVLVDKVTESFKTLLDSNIYPSIVNPILDYFEGVWIGRPSRCHKTKPYV